VVIGMSISIEGLGIAEDGTACLVRRLCAVDLLLLDAGFIRPCAALDGRPLIPVPPPPNTSSGDRDD
jgi:hypothetical protein